ncbi:MAG: hypothetical protein KAI18_01700 [Candidatus Aenigmarchaeota archaeon]|nr:hypothetical protein [Candidatus Aenigmarchaeota archaeon]
MGKEPVVFTRYDVRGEYPSELDEEFALKFGKAIGTFAKKMVVVGFDTRQCSRSLKSALVAGILSTGVDVIDVGLGPTDKVALGGNHYGADLSVMITASHHNWTRNGFKLMYPKGNGFSNADMAKIKKLFMSSKFRLCTHKDIGFYTDNSLEFDEVYISKAIYAFKKYSDRIDATVVVDCCEGGASVTTPIILERLGAKVIRVNCNTFPSFSIAPEPKDTNRKNLVRILKKNKADLIVGHDPDADRIFAYDSLGDWISGDDLFCIFAKIASAKKIVASLDTSKILEDVTGAEVIFTPVGDIFVSKKAIEVGADFCGEPNGHYAFPEFCWYNSGTFCALVLAAKAKELVSMRTGFPKYHTFKKKITFLDMITTKNKMVKIKEMVISDDDNSIISDDDGVKFEVSGVVCFVRSSGTSPIVRVVCESKDAKEIKMVFDDLSSRIEGL